MPKRSLETVETRLASREGQQMTSMQRGLWSGVIATSAMTVLMLHFQKRMNSRQRSPLPPATLSHDMAAMVGVASRLNPQGRENLSMLSHFGYGILCSALYSWGNKALSRTPASDTARKGLLYGLGVWGVSYLAGIPAFNLRASSYRMPLERNVMMIASHLMWGWTLAFTERELQLRAREDWDGARKAPLGE